MIAAAHSLPIRVQAPASLWTLLNVSHKRILFTVAALLVGLSFVYLSVLNAVATRGYEAGALEDRLSELQSVHRGLELQVAELRATPTIEARLSQLDMVETYGMEYLSPTAAQVAVR